MSSSTASSSPQRDMSEILALLQEIANRLPNLNTNSPAAVQLIHHHETHHDDDDEHDDDDDEGALPSPVQPTRDVPSSSSSSSSGQAYPLDLGSLDPKAVWLPQAYREVAGQVGHIPLGPACVLPSADGDHPLSNALHQQFEALLTALRVCVASGKEAGQLPYDDLQKKVTTVLLHLMRLQLDTHDALQGLRRVQESPSAPMKAIRECAAISAPPPPPVGPVQRGTTVGESCVYARYFKMVAVGVPREAVKQKMLVGGLDPDVLDMNPSAPLPSSWAAHKPVRRVVRMERYFRMLRAGVPVGAVEQAMEQAGIDPTALHAHGTIGESPVIAPYLKMVAVGVPREAVKQKMRVAGLDASLLDMDPGMPLLPSISTPKPRVPSMNRYLRMLRAGVPLGAVEQLMTIEGADPKALQAHGTVGQSRQYARYLKMVSFGVPREAVKQRMAVDGLDPAVLDMDPSLPLPTARSASSKKLGRCCVHLDRYFRMLRAGVPVEAVEQAMKRDGLDPASLYVNGTIGESRKLARYFRMVAVGVPREAIRQRMAVEGLDPALLDMDPSLPMPPPSHPDLAWVDLSRYFRMLRAGVPVGAAEQAMKQAGLNPDAQYVDGLLSRSRVYAPYLKMIAVGVPVGAINQKMMVEGFDPFMIDLDASQPVPKRALGRVTLHRYFRMLRVGVPVGAVEQAMAQAGLDPACMLLRTDP